jgi:predicted alpha/beta hydrolase family esterase
MEKSNPKIKQKKAPSLKVCGLCGKSESWNWARHWRNNHPNATIMELQPGDIPSNPYDESWLRLISPISVRK